MNCRAWPGALIAVIAFGLLPAPACKRGFGPAGQGNVSSAPPTPAPAASGAAAAVKLCEHQVPADQCTKCNPDLVAVFKELGDWCAEHGLPESHCRTCNPKLSFATAAVPKDWCKEHAVPESKCTKCNPSLIPKFIAADDYCREHGFPESVCPYCHPELPRAVGQAPPEFPAPGTKVRLASAETDKDVGIRTVRVERKPVARSLEVVGELAFDGNRLAQLSARGEALILEVNVDVGDDVRAGQTLLVLASGAVGSHQAQRTGARARVEAARAAFERERALADKGISPRRSAEEAARELAAAEADLSAAGAALKAAGAGAAGQGGRYVLAAPFAGTVVAREAVVGKSAQPDQVLVQVADLSKMWAELEVPEADAGAVASGQSVTLTFEGTSLQPIEARVSRIAASVDRDTRTVRARVELANPDRRLKAGTFVRATIQTSPSAQTVVVPAEAIQRAQGTSVVFVKTGQGLYEPRAVKVGPRIGAQVEVLEGLDAGAEVVTTGAFLLRTEILKDSIGAGCCDEGK